MLIQEKSTSGVMCYDNVTCTTTWNGYVGLMYPSDYGYASSGGTTANRETCLNRTLFRWQDSVSSDCYQNDWLYISYGLIMRDGF